MGASSSIKRKSYSDDCIDNQLTSIGKMMTSIRFMMIGMIMMIGMMIMNDHDDRNDDKHDDDDDDDELMLKIVKMMTSLLYHYYKDHIILSYDTSSYCVSHQLLILLYISSTH